MKSGVGGPGTTDASLGRSIGNDVSSSSTSAAVGSKLDDLRIYETTQELEARLATRQYRYCNKQHVTLADVEGEMAELKTDMEDNEVIKSEIAKVLDEATKRIVIGTDKERRRDKLTAARICQIQNRILKDPTLYADQEAPSVEHMDNQVEQVKRNLIKQFQSLTRQPTLQEHVKIRLNEKARILQRF